MAINLFAHASNTVSFPAGTTIFTRGDEGTVMYGVQSGAVDIIIDGVTVETVEAGGIFGEMSLIEGAPRVSTAIASSDALLVPVDEDGFTFMVQQTPHFAMEVMRTLARRLRIMNERYIVSPAS